MCERLSVLYRLKLTTMSRLGRGDCGVHGQFLEIGPSGRVIGDRPAARLGVFDEEWFVYV